MATTDKPRLDETMLEYLYGKLERPIFNVVYRWLWNPQEAQDVVQEAFVRLWKMRDRIVLQTVEPLLYRIALNLAANRRRSRRFWRFVTLDAARQNPAPGPQPDRILSDRERREALRRAVDTLPGRLRRVVMLCEFSQLTYEQVGQVLSIPAGTVASRRHAALRRLREALGGTEEVDDEA